MTVPELRSDWCVEIPQCRILPKFTRPFFSLEVGSGHETSSSETILDTMAKWVHHKCAEFSPEFSYGIAGGCVLGGVQGHINAFKLYLLEDQRKLLTESPKI